MGYLGTKPANAVVTSEQIADGVITPSDLAASSDFTFNGVKVGKGGGAVASNTAVGYLTLSGTNTAGANSAYGYGSMLANTSGGYNTAVGMESLRFNTTASNNTAVGYQAGYTNSLGGNNTFIGYLAGYTSNYNGTAANTCIGVAAGYSLTTGVGNCFIGGGSGGNSGYAVTTGSKNTILGSYTGNQGGLDIRTASNYIVLSDGDGNPRGYFDGSGYLNLPAARINGAGNLLRLATDAAQVALCDTGVTAFYPFVDNTTKLGYSSQRWTVVYATTGTINTSDENQKQQIRSLDDAELAVARRIKGLIKAYKLNDSVAEKGDAARIHIGVIAQEVQSAFIAEGLDPSKYGMFCSDTWYEVDGKSVGEEGLYTKDSEGAVEVTRLGIRYEELLAFVIATL